MVNKKVKKVEEKKEVVVHKDNILEIKTSGSTLKNLFDTLKQILTDINIIVTPKGVKVVQIDNKGQCVLHLFLDANSFGVDCFYCKEERVVMGIDIDIVYRSLKSNQSNDFITLAQDINKVFTITYENLMNGIKVSDIIPLKHLQDTQIADSIQYPNPIKMDSLRFQNICRQMCSFGATILEIRTTGDELIFANVDGQPKRTQTVTITNGKKLPLQQGRFLLSYLKPFSKSANLSVDVLIYLKNEEPLTLSYQVDTLGIMKFMLVLLE
jgi:proliferating cell nuclear antigen PCNA